MQGIVQAIRTYREKLLRSSPLRTNEMMRSMILGGGHGCATSNPKTQEKGSNDIMVAESSEIQHKGLENVTVAEVLMTKEGEKIGSWLWCHMDDTVYDAVKHVCFLKAKESLQTNE